jgi:hypothetical protein
VRYQKLRIRARYEFSFKDYRAFAQIDAEHQSHSLATADRLSLDLQGNSIAYDLPAFTTYNGAVGVGKDDREPPVCASAISSAAGIVISAIGNPVAQAR